MKIVVGSQSAIKLEAVRRALQKAGLQAKVVGVKALSKVPEQPVDNETVIGARNRAAHANQISPGADFTIAIESGIFRQPDGSYQDKAVVLILDPAGQERIYYSAGVEIPLSCVQEAQKRGFDKWTAGKIVAEKGLSTAHDDPHLGLTGKPRVEYLIETLEKALNEIDFKGTQ